MDPWIEGCFRERWPSSGRNEPALQSATGNQALVVAAQVNDCVRQPEEMQITWRGNSQHHLILSPYFLIPN